MEPHDTFTVDKTDWYSELDGGIRVWKPELVYRFWQLVKVHKIDKEDYNFENIIFPSFSHGTIEQLDPNKNYFVDILGNGKTNILQTVEFKNCRFQGNMFFLGQLPGIIDVPKADITFLQDLKFEKCVFENEFRLQAQKIIGNLSISKCDFLGNFSIAITSCVGKMSIHNCHFVSKVNYHQNRHTGNTNFGSCVFEKRFQFSGNKFDSIFSINTAEFNGVVDIHSNTYNANGSFVNLQLNDQSSFKHEIYNKFQFQDLKFSSKNHLIEDVKCQENGVLTFRNQYFTNSVAIRNCDTSKMRFLNSDISDIKFSSCTWNAKERLILFNENNLNKERINEIRGLESLYRQLKKNFESERDWELAGKAYVSELTFRKQRLKVEKNYFSLLIYWFYDFFGGYTQNYYKPMLWFISLTFLVFPEYYYRCEEQTIQYSDAYIKSIAASMPWLNTNLEYENWGILALQKTLSAILLAFIILALRKRFKE